MSEPLLSVRGVSKRFRDVEAVRDVSFDVARGETFALVGESGSGKSTLARMIARLIAPTSGRILFEGRDLATLDRRALLAVRRRLQIVFQDPFAALDPRMTIAESLGEPLAIHALREPTPAALLSMVHLDPELAARHPHQLSGGQRQRVCLARALAVSPILLVLDEPLSALDLITQEQMLALLTELRAKLELTCVFISHDLAVVRRFASRLAVLHRGRIVDLRDTAEIRASPGGAG